MEPFTKLLIQILPNKMILPKGNNGIWLKLLILFYCLLVFLVNFGEKQFLLLLIWLIGFQPHTIQVYHHLKSYVDMLLIIRPCAFLVSPVLSFVLILSVVNCHHGLLCVSFWVMIQIKKDIIVLIQLLKKYMSLVMLCFLNILILLYSC